MQSIPASACTHAQKWKIVIIVGSTPFRGLGFVQHPYFYLDTVLAPPTPAHRQKMGLLWSIAALTMITFQLPADGRFVHSDAIGEFRLIVIQFLKHIYLISLFLDKLFVGSQKCSFNLAVREALILPHLTSLSAFKVVLGS